MEIVKKLIYKVKNMYKIYPNSFSLNPYTPFSFLWTKHAQHQTSLHLDKL